MPLNLSPEQSAELKRRLASGELSPNAPIMKQLWVTNLKGDPLAFAAMALKHQMIDQGTGTSLPSATFHKELIELAMNNRFLALAAPRNHAKSTVITLFYVLYCVLYQTKKNIVIVSSTEEMAVRFLRRVKDELDTANRILWAFGSLRSDKWSETEIRTSTGVVVHAKGRGAQLRGLVDGANRPDLVICDDLEADQSVRSELQRYDLESWFNGTVLPTIAPTTGQVIVIGTILHMDSLLNRLVGTDPLHPDKSKLYPEFVSRIYAAADPDFLNSLWPERFSIEQLLAMKRDYMARDQLSKFFMEWMNDPIPEENATFKDFTFFDPSHDLPPHLTIECFVDVGGGSVKKGADDTAIVVTGTDEDNVMYVLDVISDKMGTDTDRIADAFFKVDSDWHPLRFVVERTQASSFLLPALEKRMLNDSHFLSVELVNPNKGSGDRRGNMSDGKYQRISAMQSPMRLGAIRLQRSHHKLIEQLQRFPNATHDDEVDALSYAWAYSMRNMRPEQLAQRQFRGLLDEPEPTKGYVPIYDDIGI